MITTVDTTTSLVLLYEDGYADDSERALRRAYREGRIVVTSVVYAELAADGHFETTADLDRFLEDFSIQYSNPSREALFRAGRAFQRYSDRRPDGHRCPSCGGKQTVTCTDRDTDLAPRQHVAADFVIGGHATADADALISFDTAFYRTCFPDLTVVPE